MQPAGNSRETHVLNLIPASLYEANRTQATSLSCKFVVVATDAAVWLVIGPVTLYPYHANLVSAFCRERVISCDWVKQPDVVKINDLSYRILGGGHVELDFARKRARFSGSSKAYGYFDLDAVRWVAASAPDFSDFSIQIES